MTREEAIKIIDCYDIGFYDLSGEKIPADKLADAFDLAIEALQFADKSPRTVKLTEAIEITLDEEAYEIGYTHGQMADRPKGEWIKKQVFNPELDKYVPLIECSVCGYEPYFGGSESKFNYCANCGARMEK